MHRRRTTAHEMDIAIDSTKRRSINGRIGLRIPSTVVREKCKRDIRHNTVMHRTELLNESDYTFVATYQLEF